MLSQNQVVKIRKALESQYEGLCTISNYQEYEKPNGSTGFKPVVISEGVPCRLSFSNVSSTGDGDMVATTSQVVKLFIAPEVEILPGSKLTITQAGVTTDYSRSGVPAVYNTHQEVTLELFKGWS